MQGIFKNTAVKLSIFGVSCPCQRSSVLLLGVFEGQFMLARWNTVTHRRRGSKCVQIASIPACAEKPSRSSWLSVNMPPLGEQLIKRGCPCAIFIFLLRNEPRYNSSKTSGKASWKHLNNFLPSRMTCSTPADSDDAAQPFVTFTAFARWRRFTKHIQFLASFKSFFATRAPTPSLVSRGLSLGLLASLQDCRVLKVLPPCGHLSAMFSVSWRAPGGLLFISG